MVDIKSIKIDRDNLAQMLGGGLPASSLCLIEGRDGTGKSVLSQRLTYGFLENGHSVSIISSELTVKGFIQQMASLRYNITSQLLNYDLVFIPIYGMVFGKEREENYVEKLMSYEQIFGSDVIIIDTFTGLIKKDSNPDESLSKLEAFFQRLLGQDKTVILTIESESKGLERLSSFYSSAHVLLQLGLNRQGGKVSQEIEVKRFAKAGGSISRTISFRVEPDIGFVLEITSVG